MALTVKHAFVSAVTDAGDPNEVGPNEWNADHTVTGTMGVVQIANTFSGAVSTTAALPQDDTIPQITEGTEVMTCAITPTSATNKLRIDVVVFMASSTTSAVNCALFQDSTANALAAGAAVIASANHQDSIAFTYHMTAGTTSSTTFRVRAGTNAGTGTVNGIAGARLYGGVFASSITVTEYTP
jgi:hypothetical protein